MGQLSQFHHDQEEEIVERVVVYVHKLIDHYFPQQQANSDQFKKTVFAQEDTVVGGTSITSNPSRVDELESVHSTGEAMEPGMISSASPDVNREASLNKSSSPRQNQPPISVKSELQFTQMNDTVHSPRSSQTFWGRLFFIIVSILFLSIGIALWVYYKFLSF